MNWRDPREIKPHQQVPVLIMQKNGEVHEGHWLKVANKYQRNVNVWRIYKTGKCIPDDEVLMWGDIPKWHKDEREFDDIWKEKLP